MSEAISGILATSRLGCRFAHPIYWTSLHLQRQFRAALQRQCHRNKTVLGITDEGEVVGLGIVVHDVTADEELRRDDLDHFACERGTTLARPAVDQDEIDGATEIAQRFPRVAFADFGV